MTFAEIVAAPMAGTSLAAGGDGLDYLEIARNSGPVGMAVLGLLVAASAVSWAIIARKYLQIRRAQDQSVRFLETFWQSKRLDAIYEAAARLSARSTFSIPPRSARAEPSPSFFCEVTLESST